MKLAWQADCMFLFLRWKRDTWISKVSFGFRFNSTPQSKCSSRDYSEDQPGSRFSWCDNGSFHRKWSSRSTRTRTNTNPNGTEANAAGRSGNARALRKRTLSPVRLALEGSSISSFMLLVVVSLQLGRIIESNLIVSNPKETLEIQVFRFHPRNRNMQSACQASFVGNETIMP